MMALEVRFLKCWATRMRVLKAIGALVGCLISLTIILAQVGCSKSRKSMQVRVPEGELTGWKIIVFGVNGADRVGLGDFFYFKGDVIKTSNSFEAGWGRDEFFKVMKDGREESLVPSFDRVGETYINSIGSNVKYRAFFFGAKDELSLCPEAHEIVQRAFP